MFMSPLIIILMIRAAEEVEAGIKKSWTKSSKDKMSGGRLRSFQIDGKDC